MRAQHRRSYRVPLEASLDQPRISEALAVHCVDKAIEPVKRMPFHVALIEPKRKFVHITVQVFRAGVMVDAVHPALHDGPDALDSICVDRTALVLTRRMRHGVMIEKETAYTGIAGSLISHQLGADFDVLHNRALQGFLVSVGDGVSDYPAAALSESHNGNLADGTASSIQLFGFVLVGFLAAKERFIDFDNTLELRQFATASLTQAVEHEPRRFLLYADFLGDLHGRNALAGRDEQIHRIEPLMEWDVRPLEDGAGTDREVKLALIAAMKASLTRRDAILTRARRAGNAFRPKARLQVKPCCLLIRKHLEKLKGADSRTAHRKTFCRVTYRPSVPPETLPLTVGSARRSLDELESVVTGEGDRSGVVFVATRPDCKPSCCDSWKVTIRERVNAHLMQVVALAEKGCTGRRGARLAHRYVDGKTVHFGGVVERSEFMAGALEANELKALIRKDRMCQGIGVFGLAVGFVRLEHFKLL